MGTRAGRCPVMVLPSSINQVPSPDLGGGGSAVGPPGWKSACRARLGTCPSGVDTHGARFAGEQERSF